MMFRFALYSLFYSCIWYVISGNSSLFFILSGFLVALILSAFTVFYLPRYDVRYRCTKLSWYVVRLLVDIIMSSTGVLKAVWTMKLDSESGVIKIPNSHYACIPRSAIYGNSITVTPGTYTISIDKDYLLVHALCKDYNDDLVSGTLDKEIDEVFS